MIKALQKEESAILRLVVKLNTHDRTGKLQASVSYVKSPLTLDKTRGRYCCLIVPSGEVIKTFRTDSNQNLDASGEISENLQSNERNI